MAQIDSTTTLALLLAYAEKDDNPSIWFKIGTCYAENGNNTEAVKWILKASQQAWMWSEHSRGDAYALNWLGDAYLEGRGVSKSIENAERCYLEVFEKTLQRFPIGKAQSGLIKIAEFYTKGTKKSLARAFCLYSKVLTCESGYPFISKNAENKMQALLQEGTKLTLEEGDTLAIKFTDHTEHRMKRSDAVVSILFPGLAKTGPEL
jgi:TPR repeat protein